MFDLFNNVRRFLFVSFVFLFSINLFNGKDVKTTVKGKSNVQSKQVIDKKPAQKEQNSVKIDNKEVDNALYFFESLAVTFTHILKESKNFLEPAIVQNLDKYSNIKRSLQLKISTKPMQVVAVYNKENQMQLLVKDSKEYNEYKKDNVNTNNQKEHILYSFDSRDLLLNINYKDVFQSLLSTVEMLKGKVNVSTLQLSSKVLLMLLNICGADLSGMQQSNEKFTLHFLMIFFSNLAIICYDYLMFDLMKNPKIKKGSGKNAISLQSLSMEDKEIIRMSLISNLANDLIKNNQELIKEILNKCVSSAESFCIPCESEAEAQKKCSEINDLLKIEKFSNNMPIYAEKNKDKPKFRENIQRLQTTGSLDKDLLSDYLIEFSNSDLSVGYNGTVQYNELNPEDLKHYNNTNNMLASAYITKKNNKFCVCVITKNRLSKYNVTDKLVKDISELTPEVRQIMINQVSNNLSNEIKELIRSTFNDSFYDFIGNNGNSNQFQLSFSVNDSKNSYNLSINDSNPFQLSFVVNDGKNSYNVSINEILMKFQALRLKRLRDERCRQQDELRRQRDERYRQQDELRRQRDELRRQIRKSRNRP